MVATLPEEEVFAAWSISHELAESVMLGGLLCGDARIVQMQQNEGYTWRAPWRQSIALHCLAYIDAGESMDDELCLVRYLAAKGHARTQEQLDALTDAMDDYQRWIRGEWQSLRGSGERTK